MHSRVFPYTALEDGSPHCPVALGFLHLARRGVFVKTPREAWGKPKFRTARRCGRLASVLPDGQFYPHSQGEIIHLHISALVWEKRT